MSDGIAITGRKKYNDKYDFYETPEWATRKALDQMIADGIISKDEDILEPCSGAGAISKVIEKYGFNVTSSDIQTESYIYGTGGVDIYKIPDNTCDIAITNPPYNLMTRKEKDGGSLLNEFLRISRRKVILLVNVFFLSSKDRKELLESSHLRHMYIHSDRVTMFPFGEEKPKNGGTKMFVWIVWDKEYEEKPTFSWI